MPFVKGHPNYSVEWNEKQKGMRHSPATEFKKGHMPWNKWRKQRPSASIKLSQSWTPERKAKMRLLAIRKAALRENYIVWKHTREYQDWRIEVFQRDDYTCQSCKKRGGILNADHIKPQSLFPSLRFVVSNGRTLCRPCHKKTPTWGIGIYNMRKIFENQRS